MKKRDEDNLRAVSELLKRAMPPVNAEPRRDLWPAMERRLNGERPAGAPWYDWALAGAVVAAITIFPQLFLLLAFHL
ncbi:MAG TPA: hypothetical protein VGR72_10250 [Candidatus Acidoferrales bacterium]|nr:hypothetical protein [Candidatus Acidoferrales bacterium]